MLLMVLAFVERSAVFMDKGKTAKCILRREEKILMKLICNKCRNNLNIYLCMNLSGEHFKILICYSRI